MTDSSTAAATSTRDPRPALIVAGVVLGVMLVRSLSAFLGWSGFGDIGFMSGFGRQVALEMLPFAVGVFLLLWLLPVRATDRVVAVLGKGLAAAAAGALLAAVVGITAAGLMAGFGLFRDLQYVAPLGYVSSLLSSVLAHAPLVMLAVLVVHLVRRGDARS